MDGNGDGDGDGVPPVTTKIAFRYCAQFSSSWLVCVWEWAFSVDRRSNGWLWTRPNLEKTEKMMMHVAARPPGSVRTSTTSRYFGARRIDPVNISYPSWGRIAGWGSGVNPPSAPYGGMNLTAFFTESVLPSPKVEFELLPSWFYRWVWSTIPLFRTIQPNPTQTSTLSHPSFAAWNASWSPQNDPRLESTTAVFGLEDFVANRDSFAAH